MRRGALIAAVAALVVGLRVERVRSQPAGREAELLASADRIAARVAELRGLAVKRPIRRGVMSRQQITRRLLERIDQEYSREDIAAEEMALKRLGLLAPEVDYLETVIALLTEQVAGFYDPWERHLYIADWGTFGGDMLLAHEIGHALQDQHFNLQRFMRRDHDNHDSLAARQAVVEGDGTAIMLEFSLDQAGQTVPWGQPAYVEQVGSSVAAAAGMMGDAPLVLREGLMFPYLAGLRFVAHFRRHHTWSRIDRIYARPPLSTEHILHPDKYESYERPHRIAEARPATLARYQKQYDNVSGELGLSIFLRHHGVPEDRARRAAAGWGGDRLVLYAPEGHRGGIAGTLAVLYTSWDAEADALEAFEALAGALPAAALGEARHAEADYVEHHTFAGEVAFVDRRGDAVLLVLGAPPARATELRRQLWTTWKVVTR